MSGDIAQPETEEIVDLGREDGQRDTGSEADNDRIGDEFDDRAESEHAHQQENHTGHERRDRKPVETELGYDIIDDDDKCACRAADLH